ncbi:tyrosine protein kinase [Blautia argi]|uniref:non-specific protein-tyrosine kinase n=2 Tax=Blautia argi TaxID=1912897 RepID=A0A2Z4UEE7_9FIRM|nr:tyrosine protein kinase [Blautia argi]
MMEQKIIMKDPRKSDYFYEESMKTLRTNIQFSSKKVKQIIFTSCYPNEGKSDLTFSISREMGKAGKRVLLLDADIRRSIYVKRYGVDQKVNGLSQYLSGQIGRDLLVYQTNYANMDVIFAGPSAPNPSELLSDALFDELLKEKREEYDYIFIDTPPIGTIIDAAVVAEKSDGAILVIESEAVSYKAAQKAKKQLERSGCHILGAVLNKVDVKKDKYYSHYYGRYGGYYKR